MTLLTMTWRNISRQPVRTTLTAFGVAIGIVAIIALAAVARGLWVTVDMALRAGGADMTIYQAGVALDYLSTLNEEETRRILKEDLEIEDIAAGLCDIVPVMGQPITILIGIRPDEFGFNVQQVVRGRPMSDEGEIVIGRQAERNFGKSIGDSMNVRGREFRISGIFETGVIFYDGAIAMDIRVLQELKGVEGKATCFQVRLKEGADAYAVAERLEREHPKLSAVVGAEQYSKVDSTLEMLDPSLKAVVFLAVLIGCIVVANTMWMTVHQRTREIGVLRAVGWSRRSVMATVLLEATCIGALACLPGCLLGVGLAKLATWLPVTNQFVTPVFEAKPFVQAICIAIVLSLLGALAPAYRASRISPVEALRYE